MPETAAITITTHHLRFMSYLGMKYGPEKVIDWVNRTAGSRRYFSAQFEKVFGTPLDAEWQRWIEWEHGWQKANIAKIRAYPVTRSKAGFTSSITPLASVTSKASGHCLASQSENGAGFLRMPQCRAARERGAIAYSEFATDPCRSLFKRVMQQANAAQLLSDEHFSVDGFFRQVEQADRLLTAGAAGNEPRRSPRTA